MFCVHCGNKISDEVKFCVFCGKPVKSQDNRRIENKLGEEKQFTRSENNEVQPAFGNYKKDIRFVPSSELKTSGKTKYMYSYMNVNLRKITSYKGVYKAILIAFLLVNISIASLYALCVSKPTIQLNEYLIFEQSGFDGDISVTTHFDEEMFIEENKDIIKTSSLYYLYKACIDNHSFDEAKNIETQKNFGRMYLDTFYEIGSLEQAKKLNVGDTVAYSWDNLTRTDETVVNILSILFFNVRTSFEPETYIVADVQEIEYIDPFECVEIITTGTNGEGVAICEHDNNGLVYSLSPENNLCNGDAITVAVDYGEMTSDNFALKYGFLPSVMTKEYVVSGLEDEETSAESNDSQDITHGIDISRMLVDRFYVFFDCKYYSDDIVLLLSPTLPSVIQGGDKWGNEYKHRFTYDENGNLINVVMAQGIVEGQKYYNIYRYEYDEYGNVISFVNDRSDTYDLVESDNGILPAYTVTNEYDDRGNLVHRNLVYSFTTSYGVNQEDYYYEYDENDRVVMCESKIIDVYGDDWGEIATAIYDENGYLSMINHKNYTEQFVYVNGKIKDILLVSTSDTKTTYSFEYDESGEHIVKYNKGDFPDNDCCYEYNEEGLLISYNSSHDDYYSYIEYIYD